MNTIADILGTLNEGFKQVDEFYLYRGAFSKTNGVREIWVCPSARVDKIWRVNLQRGLDEYIPLFRVHFHQIQLIPHACDEIIQAKNRIRNRLADRAQRLT